MWCYAIAGYISPLTTVQSVWAGGADRGNAVAAQV